MNTVLQLGKYGLSFLFCVCFWVLSQVSSWIVSHDEVWAKMDEEGFRYLHLFAEGVHMIHVSLLYYVILCAPLVLLIVDIWHWKGSIGEHDMRPKETSVPKHGGPEEQDVRPGQEGGD